MVAANVVYFSSLVYIHYSVGLVDSSRFLPKAVVRGRELRKGSVPWCCCSIHLGSVLVVQHLTQPDGLLGMGVSEMTLVLGEELIEVPPAWDQRGQDEGNSALETKLSVWNVRGTGTTLAQIHNSAGQTSHLRIR